MAKKPLSVLPEDHEDGLDPMVFFTPLLGKATCSINLRYEASVDHMIEKILANGKLPFETKTEFWRWAGSHGLRVCAEALQDPELLDTISRRRGLLMLAALKQEEMAFEQIAANIDQTIGPMLQRGDPHRAIRALKGFIDVVDGMNDSDYRKAVLDLLRQRYPRLVAEALGEPVR